jgi:hypothetical protein
LPTVLTGDVADIDVVSKDTVTLTSTTADSLSESNNELTHCDVDTDEVLLTLVNDSSTVSS